MARSILIAILLCLPNLGYVLYNRDVPHFGILEDDGVYLIGAKSIAETGSYRVLNLPNEPPQTKYPPLYPLLLTPAWKFATTLPQKVTAALLTSWLSLPIAVALFHAWLVRRKFPPKAIWIVTGLFALNPWVLFFTANLGSEMFFMVWLFLAIRSAEKGDAAIAGIYASLGFLARTAGIALLPAAVVYYLLLREPRKAAVFTASMSPAILGWTLWSRLHASPGHDLITLYYTNYLGYQFLNVGFDNISVVLWKNLSEFLESCGSYLIPFISGLLAKLILQPIALAMILGAIRIARNRSASLYPIFGAFSTAMLLVWHFAPNQRFVLPLIPLLLAGFWKEAEHFSGLVRTALHHPKRDQRIVAHGFAGFLIAILAAGAGLQIYMWISVIPGQAREDRAHAAEYASVYRWIADNTPPGAKIIWENDTNLYLTTGRHSAAFLIPTRQWYRSENDEDLESYKQIDRYARDLGYEYVVLPQSGPHRDDKVLAAARENLKLKALHEETGGIVYQVGN